MYNVNVGLLFRKGLQYNLRDIYCQTNYCLSQNFYMTIYLNNFLFSLQ